MRVSPAALVAAVALFGCSEPTPPPPAEGAVADRIVVLAPHLAELAFAAGAGAQVVGVSAYTDYPPEALELPSVGDAFTVAFSPVGSRLILLSVFLFGMTIFTDLSWLRLMDRLGAWSIAGFTRARDLVLKTLDDFRDRRQREKAVEARKVVITEHVEKEYKIGQKVPVFSS